MAEREPIRVLAGPGEAVLAEAPHTPHRSDPCALVIFGASGDLTKRLLVPALYNLCRTNALPENFALIGVARSQMSDADWRKDLRDFLGQTIKDEVDEAAWDTLARTMHYVAGDVGDAACFDTLRGVLDEVSRQHGTHGNVIFYLAVADKFFGPIVDGLGAAKLTDEGQGWRRVVIEKPFGNSYASARALDARIQSVLKESQIFRIDHFLGKDPVQSIMAFRFANGLFEPVWSRDRIDHVQITVAETVGVETRADFYEATGALRDMVPNHVFALVSMIAMEPPVRFDEAAVRSKKADVFKSMRSASPADVVRGQYGAGEVNGKPVKAYRDEAKVSPQSDTETYVAMRLEIDNWRWAGVPFYIRTGKHMCVRNTEVAICFKQAPFTAFEDTSVDALHPNWLVLRIQPNEGISLQFQVKRRGPAVHLATVKMDFHYDDWFARQPNVGYETLIHDVILGDPTLFMRADMVEQAWRVVQPVLDAWAADPSQPVLYESGSDGPVEAAELLAGDGRRGWRSIRSTLEDMP